MNDREIIEGYVTGNASAYKEVVAWIADVVKSYVWLEQISRDDVVSDVSEKLLLNLRNEKFQFDSSFKTYVQRLTRYTIVDLVRGYKRTQQLLTKENLHLADVETPLQLYESKEEAFLFGRVFSLLRARCRSLLQMLLLDSMSYKEVAVKLSTTETAVKSQVFRCKSEAAVILGRIS